MEIRSTDPTRQRTIDDVESEPTNQVRETKRACATPDWDRIPTLDSGAASALEAGRAEAKALKPKLEKLAHDIRALKEALGPYSHEVKEMMHAAHELEEAFEMFEHAHETGPLASQVYAIACAKALHGGYLAGQAYLGMKREAPETAEKVKPILADINSDIDDLKATVKPSVDRPINIRA